MVAKIKNYLAFLIVCAAILPVSTVLAQTLTTDAPVPQKTWEILLKLVFPVLMTVIGPFVTSFITKAHPSVKYLVASLASMLVGAGAGAIPDFPLTIESAATIGVTSGAVGQALFLHGPKTHPS